jgi:hypothetical protein
MKLGQMCLFLGCALSRLRFAAVMQGGEFASPNSSAFIHSFLLSILFLQKFQADCKNSKLKLKVYPRVHPA